MLSSAPNKQPNFYDHPLVRTGAIEYRKYQASIAEAAVNGNTLVVLPTALGKTIISALVAANILYSYRRARVLVMAPTRPLVVQHRESFLRILKLCEDDAVILTGHTPPEMREVVWKGSARVVFATPQVVRNDLMDGRFTLTNFGLLIFDECHRAVKEYAYTDVASFYQKQADNPLILAMTASPGSKLERIQDVCENLSIEQIFYRTEEDDDVKPYLHAIKVDWRCVDLPVEYAPLEKKFRKMLMDRLRYLSEKGLLRKGIKYVGRRELVELGDLLRYRLEVGIEEEREVWMRAIVQQSMALTIFHMIELLLSQGPQTLSSFVEKMEKEKMERRSYRILLSEMRSMGMLEEIEQLKNFPHPKVIQLKQIISDHLRDGGRGRILVFSQYRDTVNHLVRMMEKVEGVSVSRFVGQATRFGERGMSQREQMEVLNKLREGTINLLICTSIAEEGLDIPEVDLLVFYEPIPSEIRYIQRRGRTGRRYPGKVIVLAANNTLDITYLRVSMRRLENMRKMMKKLSKILSTKPLRPKPPAEPLTLEELMMLERKLPPPFAEAKTPIQEEAEDVEKEVKEEISKNISKASRKLYMKLLEHGGKAKIEALLSDLEIEGYASTVAGAALEKLQKDSRVIIPQPGTVAIQKTVSGKEYEVTVERILQGEAIVFVDGRWRARLVPEDYNGPRPLLKKNTTFRAVGKLYHLDGVLYLRVYHVIGIEEE
ncbi:MAG: helicase-related protein [Thermoproteota archaeon]